MTAEVYAAPLDQLLALGDARPMKPWPDYLALGIGAEHIPELIRLATDSQLHDTHSGGTQIWAPGHAWRALAQLHAAEAAQPLVELFSLIDATGDDFVGEDLPEAFGMLGQGAIPALMAYAADDTHGLWARVAAAHSLEKIGTRHPETRETVAAVLAGQLGLFAQQDPMFNGSLVAYLVDLRAIDAVDVIQNAFAAGQVAELVIGDWQAVQARLGLQAQLYGSGPAPRIVKSAAPVRMLSKAARPAPRPQPSALEQIETGLARTFTDAESDLVSGPKRKHHRKRK